MLLYPYLKITCGTRWDSCRAETIGEPEEKAIGEGKHMPQSYDEIPVLMTVEQFAAVTGSNADNVRRNIRKGLIPADKVNKRYLIYRDQVFANAAAHFHASHDGAAEGVVARG